jgi:2-methylcitrate dehydratase
MELTSEKLSTYTSEFSLEKVPEEAIEKGKRLVLDSLGCCLGAYASPPSKVLRRLYARPADDTGATVIGSGVTVPVEYATLINSTMVRYLDFNDAYISEGRACHPSDHIPALLAVAEAEGKGGAELLEAIVLAYELQGTGLDTGALWDNGFDYVTWGLLSGVASVGKLMDLSGEQLVDALGIAGSSSNALGIARLGEVTMWKGVAHPYANHNVVQACQMARAGMTGPPELFEGDGGFFQAVSRGPVTFERLANDAGDHYRITSANVKPFACGYYMQTTVTAIHDLVDEHDIASDDVEAIEVETFQQAVDVLASSEKWDKDLTRETADHSIPYTVAVTVIDGKAGPRQYQSDRLTDPQVHALMDRTTVVENPDLTAYSREHPDEIPSMVRVQTGDATYQKRVNYPLGHAKNPMSDAQLEAKMRDMATDFLTDAQIGRTIDACYDLDSLSTVDGLLDDLTV